MTQLSHNSTQPAARRRLGLIFPVSGRGVPEEGLKLYGERIEFVIANLNLKTMTPTGYDQVISDIPARATELAERGAEAIMVMGTSLTFYQGRSFNEKIVATVAHATGLPVSTMSNGIINALRATGTPELVCATAYNDEVNSRLQHFLEEYGFNIHHISGLRIEAVDDIFAVNDEKLITFCADVTAQAPRARALLVSCGGLITLEVLDPLEKLLGIPAVSSTPHALYEGAKLLGLDASAAGFGSILQGKPLKARVM